MSKYYCPVCGKEVRVNRLTYLGEPYETVVTCGNCYINARSVDDKVLDLFSLSIPGYIEEAFTGGYEAGLKAAKDEDLNWTKMNLVAMGMV